MNTMYILLIAYTVGALTQLPRELKIYAFEDHPSTSPNPDLFGAAILVVRLIAWPLRFFIPPPRGQRPDSVNLTKSN